MTPRRKVQLALAATLVVMLAIGMVFALRTTQLIGKTRLIAYFDNSNGIYPGDEVRVLGVRVGEIATIEPQPLRAKITFWVDDTYKVPADAKAVILSPSLVTARAIQLTPVYTGGPALQDGGVIPQNRTAVPVEWDDLRTQIDRLSQTLQPDHPGGVSSLGAFINTVADNLRGQGPSVRNSIVNLSESLSILGDHSQDLFGTVKSLSALVSALQDSGDLLRALNRNFAGVTGRLANQPDEVGVAIADLNAAVKDVQVFVADNRESLGTTSDKLAAIAVALGQSLPDVKQALHVFPNTLQNYINTYNPAQAAVTGAIAGTNFSNPLQFICSAVQAASRLNAEQSAKLCVQYLAPIVKNRQYNFLGPIGMNPLVGTQARPNEITYSEDWLRPDHVPPAAPGSDQPATVQGPAGTPGAEAPLAAESSGAAGASAPTVATNPADGLPGLMLPPGGGS